jgi:hypothetical protein
MTNKIASLIMVDFAIIQLITTHGVILLQIMKIFALQKMDIIALILRIDGI